eukprot:12885111-Ditylum_brightwellii.AAC.1
MDGYTFSGCKSIQKAQLFTECGDSKGGGYLTKGSTFLHNTKVLTLKFYKDKSRKEESNHHHPQGRKIAIAEMLHIMLKYPV